MVPARTEGAEDGRIARLSSTKVAALLMLAVLLFVRLLFWKLFSLPRASFHVLLTAWSLRRSVRPFVVVDVNRGGDLKTVLVSSCVRSGTDCLRPVYQLSPVDPGLIEPGASFSDFVNLWPSKALPATCRVFSVLATCWTKSTLAALLACQSQPRAPIAAPPPRLAAALRGRCRREPGLPAPVGPAPSSDLRRLLKLESEAKTSQRLRELM